MVGSDEGCAIHACYHGLRWLHWQVQPSEISARTVRNELACTAIIVIIPFVMVIYFGLATIICNEIVAGRPILPLELSLRKLVAATVTRVLGTIPAIQLAHAGRKASSQRPWHGTSRFGPIYPTRAA